MQEKDLDLNSEKWIRLWKGRNERTRARVEMKNRAGNKLDFVKHRLGKKGVQKEKGCQNGEVRTLCSLL